MLSPALHLWLRTIPDSAHSTALAALVTHLLRGQPLRERLAELAGKRVALDVVDAGARLAFEITAVGLKPAGGAAAHVTIRGSLDDFVALATRREDPDTLFFNRRLSLEGETEAGLHVKNLLDALEYDTDAHLRAVLGPSIGRTLAGALRASPLAAWLPGLSASVRGRGPS